MPAVFKRLRDAIVTLVSPTNVIYETQPDLVVPRKRPRRAAHDPDKLLVVSGKQVSRMMFTAEDDSAYECEYEFLVTSIIPNDAKAIPDGIAEQWREAIQNLMLKPDVFVTLVPEVSHCEVVSRPSYAVSALEKNFDFLPTQITVHTIEART